MKTFKKILTSICAMLLSFFALLPFAIGAVLALMIIIFCCACLIVLVPFAYPVIAVFLVLDAAMKTRSKDKLISMLEVLKSDIEKEIGGSEDQKGCDVVNDDKVSCSAGTASDSENGEPLQDMIVLPFVNGLDPEKSNKLYEEKNDK